MMANYSLIRWTVTEIILREGQATEAERVNMHNFNRRLCDIANYLARYKHRGGRGYTYLLAARLLFKSRISFCHTIAKQRPPGIVIPSDQSLCPTFTQFINNNNDTFSSFLSFYYLFLPFLSLIPS